MEKQGLENRVSRRQLLKWAGLGTAGVLLAACQPQIVEVEKIVEKEVTKIVKEVVKETIIVAGTPQVVEKEVTKIVKEVVKEVVEATPAPPEKVELVWTIAWGGDYGQMNVGFAEMYMERNPNVSVEGLPGKGDDQILTAIAGGNPPDVNHAHFTKGLMLYIAGANHPIEPYIDASETASPENYIQRIWDLVSYGGVKYALPYLDAPMDSGFIWNKRRFGDVGLDPEVPPETLDEAMAMGEKLTTFDEDGNIAVLGINPSYFTSFMHAPYFKGGELCWDPIRRVFNHEQEPLIELYTKAYEYAQKIGGYEKMSAFGAANQGWLTDIFNENKVMHEYGAWIVGEVESRAPEVLPNIGVTWRPNEIGVKICIVGTHQLMLCRGCPHPDEAWDLVEFLCASHEVGDSAFDQKQTWYPWQPWRDAHDWSTAPPQFHWFLEGLEIADVYERGTTGEREVRGFIGRERDNRHASARDAILLGELDPREGLRRLDEELQPIMDEAIRRYTG